MPQRIGDAERDQAVEYLREHLAAGRLTATEFDERLSSALTAKTAGDLEPLFRDLPEPRPGGQPPAVTSPLPWAAAGTVQPAARAAPPPISRMPDRTGKVLGVVSAVAWPLVIMTCFVIGWEYWWLLFIPITLSSLAGSLSPKPSRERGELEQ